MVADLAYGMAIPGSRNFRVNVLGLHHFFLKVFMDNGLPGNQEPGSHLHSLGTQHKSRRKTPAVADTACGNYRDFNPVCYLGHQAHGSGLANMPASFHTLRNHRVCTASLHQLRHCHTCHYRHHLDTRFLEALHQLRRIARPGSHHFNPFFHYHLRHLRGIGIHQHDIDPYGLIRQFPCLPDLAPYHLCWGACRRDHAKPSRLGYGSG